MDELFRMNFSLPDVSRKVNPFRVIPAARAHGLWITPSVRHAGGVVSLPRPAKFQSRLFDHKSLTTAVLPARRPSHMQQEFRILRQLTAERQGAEIRSELEDLVLRAARDVEVARTGECH